MITEPEVGAGPADAEVGGGGGMGAYEGYVVVGTGCPTNWLGFASWEGIRT